jgi:hypothetical protein
LNKDEFEEVFYVVRKEAELLFINEEIDDEFSEELKFKAKKCLLK